MGRLRVALLAVMWAGLACAAAAQGWPAKPVRIVNTFAVGGTADLLARTVADHLSSAFKQQFFVETRAGAGGVLGVQSVAHADPDGYNFVITTLSLLVIAPLTNPKGGYDPMRDLSHVAFIAGSPIVLVVNPAQNVRSLPDFLAHARASARPLTYSSSGIGSNGQLVAESFAQKAGVAFEHVPYKGASQGITDLIGGHIGFSAQTLSSASAFIRAGTLVPIAHTGDARLPDYPNVPTFKELGYPDLVTSTWFALSGPAGLPKEIVDTVNREVVRIMARPEVQAKLRADGQVTRAMTAPEFNAFIAAETARWKPVVAAAGLIAAP